MRYELKLPKRFDEFTAAQLRNMRVKLVHNIEGHLITQTIRTIEDAAAVIDLRSFAGPMYDEIDGDPCLRFEAAEVSRELSR